ncbi:MAG: hypothetical protein JNN12_00420 [Bacteroidetes Order II. Incertae sedis bacterium]|nr:hypothetical protein [Bacteroidetes Order II. bacterium]
MKKTFLSLLLPLVFAACDSGNPSPEATTPTSHAMKAEWAGVWQYKDGAFQYDLHLTLPNGYRFFTTHVATDKRWYEDWGTVAFDAPDAATPDRYPMAFTRIDAIGLDGVQVNPFKTGEKWQWNVTFMKDSLLIATNCQPYTYCRTPVYVRSKKSSSPNQAPPHAP